MCQSVINRLLGGFLLLSLSCLALPGYAQQPSADQIAQFKSLPKSEQKRLAKSIGIDTDRLQKPGASNKLVEPVLVEPSPRGEARALKDANSKTKREANNSDDIDLMLLAQSLGCPEGFDGIDELEGVEALTEFEGVDRIKALMELEGFEDLSCLEIDTIEKESPEEAEELMPYGYDLFSGVPTTFAPATDIPVPAAYILGPGDNIIVQLYGKENAKYELMVGREGLIQLPDIGPISVAGLSFQDFKALLSTTIQEQMIGVNSSISMGQLRSIRVFILGDAAYPGSYTVSSLSTLTNALFVSGGVDRIGSLRHIQLKRSGKLVSTLDLYDLLLRGDTSKDARLQPGDVIFVPPIGKTAGIEGEVRRPAIYELAQEETVAEIVELAGGLTSVAFPKASRIERINAKGHRVVVDLNLHSQAGKSMPVMNADLIQIGSILESREDSVELSGHVKRPGWFAWKPGLKINDIIADSKSLLPNADQDFVLVQRELQSTGRIQILKVNIAMALGRPASSSNIDLNAKDKIIVFSRSDGREEAIAEINERLKMQVGSNHFPAIAEIVGRVRIEGEYPVYEGMTAWGLIEAASGMLPETDLNFAVLSRRDETTAYVTVKVIDLATESRLETIHSGDILYLFHRLEDRTEILKPLIAMLKYQGTKDKPPQFVTINGSVRFPGEYPLTVSLDAQTLIAYAGGLTDKAFGLQAEVTRYSYDSFQQQVIEHRTFPLVTHPSVGEFTETAGEKVSDIAVEKLRAEDHLTIKHLPNWVAAETVEINGEVTFPGTYAIQRGESLYQVLARAGGLNSFAYAKGAIFTRSALKELEAQRIKELRQRLKADISFAELQEGKVIDEPAKNEAEELVENLESIEAQGRMVIDLDKIVADPDNYDLILRDGDTLRVPRFKQEITIVGEVQHPTSHIFDEKLTVDEYIDQSGGFNLKADKGRLYIVKSNGRVFLPQRNKWFKASQELEAGDTVVVPLDAERVKPIALWTDVTQIFYQMALAAAAVASF